MCELMSSWQGEILQSQVPLCTEVSRWGPNDPLHSKSRDFFSVSKQFYILAEVESPPFINAQILIFFINNIEGTLNQKVLFVITYFLN